MICLIIYDAIFTLYNGDIEELEFGTFLEYIIKESIKLLSQSLKTDPMLCGHKDIICLYCKNILICLISSSEDIMVRGNPYNFHCDEDRFK